MRPMGPRVDAGSQGQGHAQGRSNSIVRNIWLCGKSSFRAYIGGLRSETNRNRTVILNNGCNDMLRTPSFPRHLVCFSETLSLWSYISRECGKNGKMGGNRGKGLDRMKVTEKRETGMMEEDGREEKGVGLKV